MRTKFIIFSLGIAVLLAGNMSSVADASWLSKAMDRLQVMLNFHQVGQRQTNIVIIDLVRS